MGGDIIQSLLTSAILTTALWSVGASDGSSLQSLQLPPWNDNVYGHVPSHTYVAGQHTAIRGAFAASASTEDQAYGVVNAERNRMESVMQAEKSRAAAGREPKEHALAKRGDGAEVLRIGTLLNRRLTRTKNKHGVPLLPRPLP